MKSWLSALFVLVLTAALLPDDAEARRLGGGRPTGVQRQAAPEKPATAPAAQQQPAQAAPAQAAPGAVKRPMSPWLGALAGLAAGIGLAALFGEELGAILMALLIAVAAVAVIGLLLRAFAKPRAQAGPQRDLQYAGVGNETVAAPPPSQVSASETLPDFRGQFTSRIPAGFNVEAFLREAKKSFVALQAANDHGNLEAIRDLVTDEMFEHLQRDLQERGPARQQTDVVTLNADLLEVVTEGGAHWASIRFAGLIREEATGTPAQFDEIWNLQKSATGDTGWMLAGIQPVS
jgi:predicted lipid-binding transport protein (Tim44 family)